MDFRGLCYRSEALPEFEYLPPTEEKPGNSYVQYEKSQMREIIELCERYAIEIIPEIEIPAHATALCTAHPEFKCQVENAHLWTLCPGNDDIWDFFKKLVGEVAELFPKSEYIHIGSDELEFSDLPEGKKRLCHWDECPRCAALREREGLADRQAEFYYVIGKIHEIVKSCGKKMIMWNDQLDVSRDVPISREIVMQFWRIAYPGRGPHVGCSFDKLLNMGFKVINSYYPYTYLDLEKYLSPEKLKSWTPFNTPEQSPELASQILGGEACSWETGNRADYPYYSYTTYPSIALFGDKLWECGDREFDVEYKNALAEFLFGSAEFTPVFECVGDLIPPRSCEKVTFVAPKEQNRELLDEMIEKLGGITDSVVAEAYALLLREIRKSLDLEDGI
jgi:N-acetyl-beta-hexosaminidase